MILAGFDDDRLGIPVTLVFGSAVNTEALSFLTQLFKDRLVTSLQVSFFA